MNRRLFLRTAGLAASAAAWPTAGRPQPATPRRPPNLLVFLPDQQRADTIDAYAQGVGRVHAPHLARLAGESCVFEKAYVTHPVCTPSRSSLLTGTWPQSNGCTHNNRRLDPAWRTLPEMLGRADWRTGYFGKWHLGDEVFAQRGFEEWVSIEDLYQAHFGAGRDPGAVSDYTRFLRERGHTPDLAEGVFSRKYASRLPIELSKPRFLEERACDFIARHRAEPWILFVSFLEPHSPYSGPLNEAHTAADVRFEPTAEHTFGADIPLRLRLKQEYQEKEFGRGPAAYFATKRNYQGLVTQIDRSIGAILGQLERLRLADQTVVVHTSDHGDMMGAHRLFEKEVMFEPSARVPWLVRLPGQRRRHRIAQR